MNVFARGANLRRTMFRIKQNCLSDLGSCSAWFFFYVQMLKLLVRQALPYGFVRKGDGC
ncbi:hypothetical protein LMG28614_03254 [Paraburkholderia ultramafica]|uniref:Uncharacterized protein n=1 Tax=Paraburkholderia ultramafica TaxID=1544867 RepID=A0A6S7B8D8_9BURK|nr:hypothetical protein LMG28614_03254 [Paraburkholderia ultramafica]